MKKIFKFLGWMFVVLLTSVSFASCSDDDDDDDPYRGTVWEYFETYSDGKYLYRLRFVEGNNAYYEEEVLNAGGTIVNRHSAPYTYTYSGSLIIFEPVQAGSAYLEANLVEGIKLVVTNKSNNEIIGDFLKK